MSDPSLTAPLFRVLALDGGGIKGTFTAAALAALEEMNPGLRLADCFDVICGTSTGGILALALGLGLTANEILEFYVEHGPAIFPITGAATGTARTVWQVLFGPKIRPGTTPSRALGRLWRPAPGTSYTPTGNPVLRFDAR